MYSFETENARSAQGPDKSSKVDSALLALTVTAGVLTKATGVPSRRECFSPIGPSLPELKLWLHCDCLPMGPQVLVN